MCDLNLLIHHCAGLFLGVGYLAGDVLESWSVRLGLSKDEVAELVAEQPALLEMSPNTVKARLVRQHSGKLVFRLSLHFHCPHESISTNWQSPFTHAARSCTLDHLLHLITQCLCIPLSPHAGVPSRPPRRAPKHRYCPRSSPPCPCLCTPQCHHQPVQEREHGTEHQHAGEEAECLVLAALLLRVACQTISCF